MAIVSGFKHDLFVSYAHFDNEDDAQGVRWVSQFQVDLKNALRQRMGERPEIFFDTRNFEAGDHVDFSVDNARHSAIFLAMLSPSYVAREFTIRELQAFCDRAAERARRRHGRAAAGRRGEQPSPAARAASARRSGGTTRWRRTSHCG